ncbi:hypothetical protein TNCT_440371 [Trichonephila clavata]|uniref:Uncharacterized protein n=1 Tax=Trichonephila clavata TaxID=2740835 RepID=A0A8X6FHA3_TRICU|nr:hypothetical protein TNCT_440371 [Trichonephila clavata]
MCVFRNPNVLLLSHLYKFFGEYKDGDFRYLASDASKHTSGFTSLATCNCLGVTVAQDRISCAAQIDVKRDRRLILTNGYPSTCNNGRQAALAYNHYSF